MYRETVQRGRRARHPTFHCTTTELASLPSYARPATIILCNNNRVKFTGSGEAPSIQRPPTTETFDEYSLSLPNDLNWIFDNISGMENALHMKQAIESGNCAIVSDGSYSQTSQQASAAWTIGNKALHRQIEGKVACSGRKMTHSAYRGELAGIYGGLMFLKVFCQTQNISNGSVLLCCDG